MRDRQRQPRRLPRSLTGPGFGRREAARRAGGGAMEAARDAAFRNRSRETRAERIERWTRGFLPSTTTSARRPTLEQRTPRRRSSTRGDPDPNGSAGGWPTAPCGRRWLGRPAKVPGQWRFSTSMPLTLRRWGEPLGWYVPAYETFRCSSSARGGLRRCARGPWPRVPPSVGLGPPSRKNCQRSTLDS